MSWSADSSHLVVDNGLGGIFLLGADGSGWRRLTQPPVFGDRSHPDKQGRVDSSPAWSPTSPDTLAFTRLTHPGGEPNASVYVVDTRNGSPRRIMPATLHSFDPQAAWSADGTRIAFIAQKSTVNSCTESALFIVSASGGEARRVSPWLPLMRNPTWSSDSSRLAYLAPRPETSCWDTPSAYDIYLTAAAGGRQKLLRTHRRASESFTEWQPAPRPHPAAR